MSTELSRLERVDLRDIWKSEAQDFTPWLAREHNLGVLAETLQMDLELEAEEQSVGPFRADKRGSKRKSKMTKNKSLLRPHPGYRFLFGPVGPNIIKNNHQ